jgi:hypothetical protein
LDRGEWQSPEAAVADHFGEIVGEFVHDDIITVADGKELQRREI